jgi:hypothetical protein
MRQKIFIYSTVRREPKNLRTTALECDVMVVTFVPTTVSRNASREPRNVHKRDYDQMGGYQSSAKQNDPRRT